MATAGFEDSCSEGDRGACVCGCSRKTGKIPRRARSQRRATKKTARRRVDRSSILGLLSRNGQPPKRGENMAETFGPSVKERTGSGDCRGEAGQNHRETG